jgi:hypothetical protein
MYFIGGSPSKVVVIDLHTLEHPHPNTAKV